MRRPKKDIQLTSYDELLGLEETPEKSMNQVVEIDLAKLYAAKMENREKETETRKGDRIDDQTRKFNLSEAVSL
ncbi:hypothetical protein [Blautia obeum]|uniref:Uncharacterized protein n=1 Tax=Blautia obeum TaxID=40520 RepID=A0A174T4P2_9FIRM|nr:hypothetical protein [Blautia obeum]CUQ04026.1 Uncharacterised protein [Blautia obeum]